ncbi:MAG: ABC transporter substrate-binding protein, partial [Clostridia bacterium]|nr:ABC transporter substrate-binding protein [Clostridia bacterium]
KEPDIVFTAAGLQEEITDKLEEVGIEVVCLDAETIEQVMDNIVLAGTITGTDKKAKEIVLDMQERLDFVQAKVAGQPVPNVFFEVWDDPLMTAGRGSFIDSLITIAGGKNIASDLNKKYVNYSLEQLLVADPEYYLLNNHAHSPAEVKERNGYQKLQAVINNRIYAIEDDLVTLPGPRIIEGLEEIAKIIHPEVF